MYLECFLLQTLAVFWINLRDIQWVCFKTKIIQTIVETGVSGFVSLCFRKGFVSCSGIIHGEPFKYKLVFLLLCHHLGEGGCVLSKAVYALCRSFKTLFLGQWGVLFEMHV